MAIAVSQNTFQLNVVSAEAHFTQVQRTLSR